jgi:hypothetical protein
MGGMLRRTHKESRAETREAIQQYGPAHITEPCCRKTMPTTHLPRWHNIGGLSMLRLSCSILLIGMLLPGPAYADCHHRRLDKVIDNGRTIQLDDGSQWEVSDFDQSEASTWQQDATITACDTELINTEEHETAAAREVKRGEPVPEAE